MSCFDRVKSPSFQRKDAKVQRSRRKKTKKSLMFFASFASFASLRLCDFALEAKVFS